MRYLRNIAGFERTLLAVLQADVAALEGGDVVATRLYFLELVSPIGIRRRIGDGVGGGIGENVFVFAEHVFFSDSNPDLGEEIFVFAYINYNGTNAPIDAFTVTL